MTKERSDIGERVAVGGDVGVKLPERVVSFHTRDGSVGAADVTPRPSSLSVDGDLLQQEAKDIVDNVIAQATVKVQKEMDEQNFDEAPLSQSVVMEDARTKAQSMPWSFAPAPLAMKADSQSALKNASPEPDPRPSTGSSGRSILKNTGSEPDPRLSSGSYGRSALENTSPKPDPRLSTGSANAADTVSPTAATPGFTMCAPLTASRTKKIRSIFDEALQRIAIELECPCGGGEGGGGGGGGAEKNSTDAATTWSAIASDAKGTTSGDMEQMRNANRAPKIENRKVNFGNGYLEEREEVVVGRATDGRSILGDNRNTNSAREEEEENRERKGRRGEERKPTRGKWKMTGEGKRKAEKKLMINFDETTEDETVEEGEAEREAEREVERVGEKREERKERDVETEDFFANLFDIYLKNMKKTELEKKGKKKQTNKGTDCQVIPVIRIVFDVSGF